MSEKKKVLVISYFFPPVSVAASHVINSIVKFFPKKDICVLRGNPKETYQGSILDNGFQSDVQQYIFDLPSIFRKRSFKIILPVYLDHLWIPAVALRALIIAKKNKIESIFTLFPNHYFLIAAYLTHKMSGLPLTIYWVDVYHEGRPHFFEKWVASMFERRILISARRNYVMTPFLQKHLREKYGIETEVLPIPTELTPSGKGTDHPDDAGEIKIVFTGRIYGAQLDAIVNMVDALKLLPEFNIKLMLITPSGREELESQGIKGNNILVFSGKRDDCIAYQQQADILFLPMAFRTARSLVVNLSLPSKVLEYFAAMRPILIHAPSESYIAHYAKQRDFAVVVDRPDPIELSEAIRQLIRNREKRNSIVENALLTLREHDARKISHKIQVDLGLTL